MKRNTKKLIKALEEYRDIISKDCYWCGLKIQEEIDKINDDTVIDIDLDGSYLMIASLWLNK